MTGVSDVVVVIGHNLILSHELLDGQVAFPSIQRILSSLGVCKLFPTVSAQLNREGIESTQALHRR